MAGNILTPLNVWGNFNIPNQPSAQVLSESANEDFNVTELHIDGRETSCGKVKIHAIEVSRVGILNSPSLLIISSLDEGPDFNHAYYFAEEGYRVLMIDLRGKTEEKFYTEYPDNISYANYSESKDNLLKIDNDVTSTCWYEWANAARYAAEYIKNSSGDKKFGALGIGKGAGILWQTLAFNDNFACAAFVGDTGWRAYNGIFKFSNLESPQFSDESLKFISGLDPQSYSKHVKCPCFVVSATNSPENDCDRAYDTLSRIDASAYRALDYSVGYIEGVKWSEFDDLKIFFKEYMTVGGKKGLPNEMDISAAAEDGKIKVTVVPDEKDLVSVTVYAAENIVNPAHRTWLPVTALNAEGGKYIAEYIPYYKSGAAFFFAKAVYGNGFTMSSYIISKKFTEKDIPVNHKDLIIFSGRNKGSETVFSPIRADGGSYVEGKDREVRIAEGPMGIEGVTAAGGLTSYKVNAEKYRPGEYSILMFDVCSQETTDFKVILKTKDETGTEYSAKTSISGGNVWYNVKFEMSKFKTAEGMVLKTYEELFSISFSCEKKFLINNVIWV